MATITEETLDITKARDCLSKMPDRLRDEQVVYVTRRGVPVFACVDIDYLESIIETLEIQSHPEFKKWWLKFNRNEAEKQPLHDHDEIMKQFG